MEELIAIAAVAAAIQKVYSLYQSMISLLTSNDPTFDDELIGALQGLSQQMTSIAQAVAALDQAVMALTNLVRQQAVDATITQIQQTQSLADAASEQLNAWLQGGRTDAATLASAQNNSLQAADAMRDTTEYFEVAVLENGVATNVFDYRMALAAYAYALTVRIAVIAASEPAWPGDPVVRQELSAHVKRMDAVIAAMDGGIVDKPFSEVNAENGTFFYEDQCTDQVSGFASQLTQSVWLPGGPAEAAALLGSLQAQNRANVRQGIGLAAFMQLRDAVAYDAGGEATGTWTPWFPIVSPGNPPAGVGSVRPTAIASPQPGVATVIWVTNDGAVRGASTNPAIAPPTWGAPFDIAPAGSALAAASTAARTLCAVSPVEGNVTVAWIAPDGSIRAAWTDARETVPVWSPPAKLAMAKQPVSLAAATGSNGLIEVFWTAEDGALRTTSTVLNASATRPITVTNSAPTAPEVVVASGLPSSSGITAVNGAAGAVAVIWIGTAGEIFAIYGDERASVREWTTPFAVTASGENVFGQFAAVSSRSYEFDIGWLRQPTMALGATVQVCSFELKLGPSAFPRTVVHSAPTAPLQVAPVRAAFLGTSIAAAGAAAGAPSGGFTLFWVADDMTVKAATRASATAIWTAPRAISAPIAAPGWGPLLALAPAPGDIALVMTAFDGTIQGAWYLPREHRIIPPPGSILDGASG